MVRATRQHAFVQENGQIVIRVPGLKPGTRTEVIVIEESSVPPAEPPGRERWSSLIGSCRGMFKSPEEADKFLSEERDAWER